MHEVASQQNEVRNFEPVIKQPVLRFLAHLVSFIFHPLFIPLYVTAFLLYLHPYAYAGITEKGRIFKLLSIALNTAFFPAFSVFIMKQLGFVDSIFLRTQRDRIIPYIVSMTFYFWAWYVSRNHVEDPSIQEAFLLATFLASIASLMANIKFKISMHAIAAGVWVTAFVVMAMQSNFGMGLYVSLAILFAGLTLTARFIVSDHYPMEIYAGFFVGAGCQLIALPFV